MIIYIFLFLISIILSYIAERKNRKSLLVLVILSFVLIAGFRGIDVGKDTNEYIHVFDLIKANDYSVNWLGIEKSFLKISEIVLSIFKSNTSMFVIMALITYSLILLRLWDFKNIASFPWMVAFICIIHFFPSLNISRQYCAAAIVFFGTRYLRKKSYFVFLLFVIAAFLFHKSSLIGISFYIFELANWKSMSKKQKIFIIIGFLFAPIYAGYVISNFRHYLGYFTNININFGFLLPIKLFLYVVSWLDFKGVLQRSRLDLSLNSSHSLIVKREIEYVSLYYLIGILLTFIGYFFVYMDRIGLVFYLFEAVYVGTLVHLNRSKSIYKIIWASLLFYILLTEFLYDGHSVIPYSFIWQ